MNKNKLIKDLKTISKLKEVDLLDFFINNLETIDMPEAQDGYKLSLTNNTFCEIFNGNLKELESLLKKIIGDKFYILCIDNEGNIKDFKDNMEAIANRCQFYFICKLDYIDYILKKLEDFKLILNVKRDSFWSVDEDDKLRLEIKSITIITRDGKPNEFYINEQKTILHKIKNSKKTYKWNILMELTNSNYLKPNNKYTEQQISETKKYFVSNKNSPILSRFIILNKDEIIEIRNKTLYPNIEIFIESHG